MDVLLHKDDGNPLARQVANLGEQLIHNHGCQTLRGLIDEQELWLTNKHPRNSEHLLFAARQGGPHLTPTFRKARKPLVDFLHSSARVQAAARRALHLTQM